MDILTLALIFLINYLFLRFYGGGKGLNIKTDFPPASTPEGRRSRIMLAGLAILDVVAVGLVVCQYELSYGMRSVVIPTLLGGGLYVAVYLTKRNKR